MTAGLVMLFERVGSKEGEAHDKKKEQQMAELF